jgi:hypothetical protein
MPTPDTVQGIQLPTFDDPPAVPNDLSLVWYAAIGRAVPRFSGTAARDAAFPSPVDGQMCVTGTGTNLQLWLAVAGAWRAITTGSALLEPWTPITAFGTNMAANSFGVSPRVKRFDDGFTRCAGGIRITTGTIANGAVLATLPAPYVPPAYVEVACATTADTPESTVRVEIRTDGTIRPMWSGSRSITWVSLDGIQWWTTA